MDYTYDALYETVTTKHLSMLDMMYMLKVKKVLVKRYGMLLRHLFGK